jgi:hypothetical protein
MIPKTAFTIWIGAPMPEKIERLTEHARKINEKAGWRYTVYGDEILKRYAEDPFVRRLNGMCEATAFIVDRLRLLVLRDEGGFWADSDFQFIRPFSTLNRICGRPEVDFVAGLRNPWREHVHQTRGVPLCDNTVMGSARGGRMVQALLGIYRADDPKHTGKTIGTHILFSADDSTVLLNFQYFYANNERQIGPNTVGIHDFDGMNLGSWARPALGVPMEASLQTAPLHPSSPAKHP